jgi:hypothetical protein
VGDSVGVGEHDTTFAVLPAGHADGQLQGWHVEEETAPMAAENVPRGQAVELTVERGQEAASWHAKILA